MKNFILLLFLWISSNCLHGQTNINYLEYFWNSDPGWGMATSVSITPNDTLDVNFMPITTGLVSGFNVLYVRAKDDSLKWTFPIQKTIYYNPNVTANAQKIEYYIDTDPGLNNGVSISTTGDSLIDQTFNVNLTNVSQGLHLLGVRMRNAQGLWSLTKSHLFYKHLSSGEDIVQIEYFIDNDPGYGLGTQIPITANDSIDILTNINLTGVQQGHHRLFIRAKSANGLWSYTPKHEFFMVGQNVVYLEYFWNTDPGIGMANSVPVTAAPIVEVNFNAITSGLTQGFNTLYVRAKNEGNIWSMPVQKNVFFTVNTQQNASELEYYIDSDPGISQGLKIPITNADTFDVTFNVSLANISPGLHRLFIRAKDRYGYWGQTAIYPFMMVNNGSNDIVQLEYFIDTDPGLGNAIQVSITPNDSIDVIINPDLSNLSEGVHTIYIRGKNEQGFWSHVQDQVFFKLNGDPDNIEISTLEYYFDQDPGLGNGNPVAITQNDTIDITAPISLSGLTNGVHKLYIRAKDVNDHWSHIHRKDINVTMTDSLFPEIAFSPTGVEMTAPNCVTNDTSGFYIINSGDNLLSVNLTENLPWLTLSPTIGGIQAGDSIWITLVATPSGNLLAQNIGQVTITNNSVVMPTATYTVVFNVPIGAYSMEVSHDSLDMGSVQVNGTLTGTITLLNTSCSTYDIDTIIHSNPLFSNNPLMSSPPTSLPGYTYLGVYDGHSYYKSNGTSNWLAAESSINTLMQQQGLNGYMVSINNAGENSWLMPLTNETDLFFGLRDADGSGTTFPCESATSGNPQTLCWKWSDGTLLSLNGYHNWPSGQPDNYSSLEDCGHYIGSTNSNVAFRGFWNDINCGNSYKHILEVTGAFPPNGTQNITINFESPTIGTYQDTMIIVSPAGIDTVYVTAEAVGIPEYSIDSDTLNLSFMGCGMDTIVTTLVYNNGAGPLDYTTSITTTLSTQALESTLAVGNQNHTGQLGSNFLVNQPITITKLGVYDSGANGIVGNIQVGIIRVADNVTVAGPITVTGNAGTLNGNFRMVNIPKVTLNSGEYSIATVGFSGNDPNGNAGNGGGPCILNSNNRIIFLGEKNSASTSFGLPTAADGGPLGRYHAGTFLYEFTTPSTLPTSITIHNPTDTIAVGDSTAIGFTLTNFNQPNGTYNYKIEILTNDTLQPLDTLHLQVTVMGEAMLTTTSSFIQFDTIPRNTQTTKEFYIKNEGCEPLYVSDISANNATIFGDNTSSIYLPPYTQHRVVVNFAPPLTGDYQDTISITTADSLYKVPLFGVASGALTFELSSYTSNVNIDNCMGMTMDTIKLYNVGDGNGTFNITNAASFPTWLQASPLSGSIAQGDSINLVLSYDAMALTNNTYTKTINIATSDPLTPNVSLSTSMFVIGAPVADVNKDTVDFHTTYFTTERFDTINISNMGCDTFEIMSIGIAAPFSANVMTLNVLPDSNASVIIKYDPNAIAVHEQIMYLNGETDTLQVVLKGDAVQYPTITTLTKDTLTLQMPYALDGSTVNAANLVVWGEQSGRRTGAYIVDGSNIHFVPTQDLFAGEEVAYTLTKYVKYANGEFIQSYSDSRNVSVWNPTRGEFVIRPTNKVFSSIPSEFYLNDINTDGLMDFLFKTSSSSVGVILRQTDNALSNIITTNHSSDINTLEQIKDFNGDGFNDLIYSSGGATTGKLTVLLNNVNGQFTNGPSFGTGFGARSFVLDFNNDGLFDIINLQRGLLSTFSAKLETHKNLGNGAFSLVQSSNWQHNINDFQYCDLNRDGYQDIIAMGIQPASTFGSWHLNFIKNYSGIFQSNIVGGGSQSLSFASKKISNIFGDKGSEPLLKHSGGTYLILNNSNVFPTSAITYNISNLSTNLIVGDIDGDNRNDLVPALNKLSVYYNISDNSFQIKNLGFSIGPVISNNMADLDTDGDLDFAFLDAQGKLWIAYNEDSNAELVLSQDTIQATYTTCSIDTTYNIDMTNIGDSTLVWQINLPTTIPTWMSIDTTYGQILADSTHTFPIHINTTGLLAGTYSYNLIINHNDTSSYRDTIHIAFTLQNDSIVTASDTALHFGLVDINVNKTLPITISNPGCAPINLTASISPTGIFTYTGAPVVVPAFGSKTIQVTANTINSGVTSSATLQLTHDYGNFAIPLTATACYVSPVTHIYEQVCTADSVGLDSMLLMNVSGCDSLVVIHHELPNTVSNAGLVAHYPFNGNANDVSGNNKHGSVNGATLSVDRFGNNNNAYSFDGTNDEIVTTYQQSISGQFTVSAWVKTNMAQQTNATEFTVIQNRGPVNQGGKSLTLGYFKHENAWRFGFDTDNQYFGQKIVMSNNNQWMHIVGVINTNGSSQLNQSHFKIYINGVLATTTPNNGSTSLPFLGLNTLKIGRHDAWNSWFQGQIDDVKIYQRALSSSEIETLYNSHLSTLNIFSQTCDTTIITIDTTILANANQYGCDSTIITQTSLESPISNQSLVGYYTFDGNAQDMSGYNNDGVVSGATLTTDRLNQDSTSYYFDGINDYVDINHSTSLNDYLNTGELTISYWINPDIGSTRDVIAKRPPANNGGFLVQANPNQMGYDHDIYTNAGWKFVVIPYTQNQWQHIVFSAKANDAIRVYKNGVLSGSLSLSGNTFVGTTSNLRLMANSMAIELFQKGKLDQLQIFSRKLTDAEIQALYNANTSYTQTCIPADIGIDTLTLTNACGLDSTVQQVTSLQTPVSPEQLKAYYPFSGNANDMSGFGNNGTVNGATLTTDRFGNANGAYAFDGVDDYINSPAKFGLDIHNYSFSYWFKANSTTTGLKLVHSQTGTGPEINNDFYNQKINFYTKGTGPATAAGILSSNQTINQNEWYHVVCTYNIDGSVKKIYINGQLDKSENTPYSIDQFPNTIIRIGGRLSNTEYFNGSIDNFQYYKRALTPAEIQALYTNASQYTFNYNEACDPINVGLDTLIYTGGSSNGCDSLSINLTSFSHAVHGSDLVAYFPYDGNAQDMSGYDLDATVSGAIRVDDRYGRDTSAYQFDGVDDYLSTAHNALFNPGNTPYAVSMHFKSEQTGQGELLIKTSINNNREFILINKNEGNINIELAKGATSQYCNTTGLALNDNKWHHLLFTRSPSATKDTQRIYIDGILVTTTIQNAILDIQPQEKLYTGIRKNWNGGAFTLPYNGVIDDITIYKRRLTSSEITDLAYEHKDADIDVVTKNDTIDFGTVVLGNNITQNAYITNTTCDTITLSSAAINPAYTPTLDRTTLLPYQSAKLSLKLTANAVGNYDDTLMVFGGLDTLSITLLGETISAAEISMSDSSAIDTFYICNQITQDSFFIYNTGQDPLNFSIASTSSYFTVNPSIGIVAEGDSIAITYTHNTTNKANGSYIDSLIISSDDNTDPMKYFVYQYSIDGPAAFGLMPDNLEFGQVGTGMSSTLPFTIFNTSCDTIMINVISSNNNDFETNYVGNTILPFASKLVNVSYHPLTQGSDVGMIFINTGSDIDTVDVAGSSCLMSPTQHLYVDVCSSNQLQSDTMAFTNQYGCDSLIVTNYLLPTTPHEAWTTFHLPFSGNGIDATGHGYNATLTNATYGPDRFNATNKAVNFDGFFDYAIISNTSMIHVDSSDFAISLWMKSLSQAAQGILSKANNGNANFFNLELINGDLKYTLSNPSNSYTAQTTGLGIADSDWHHVLFSKRKDNSQNITNVYIDNALVKADTFATPSSMNLVDNIYLGMIKSQINGTLDKSFHGTMDNVRWLSHHPSTEEINRLYLEGIPHTTTEQVTEIVCVIDSVGLDTMSYVNQFGCDSLVVVKNQLPSGLTNQTIPGYTYLGQYNNHSYYKSNGTSTWLNAKSNVITLMNQLNMTGYLASINDAGENAWLLTKVPDPVIFIGLSDGNGTGSNPPCEAFTSGNPQLYCWLWEDGTNNIGNNYQNWALSEPNDASGSHDYTNFYGNTFGNVPYRGKWNDLGNTTPYPHILEISGVNQTPTLVATQNCSPINIGIDTTILANANQYGCDSTIITTTSLHSPISPVSLVAFYTFDGNANDMSGLGNDGVVNGATLTTDRFGNVNGAYSFDGNLSKITISDNNTLDFDTKFSFSLWIKPLVGGPSTNYFLNKWNSPNGDFQVGIQNQNNGKFKLFFGIANYPQYNDDEFITSSTQFAYDEWTHIYCSFDNGLLKLYGNANLVASIQSNILRSDINEYASDDIVIGHLWNNQTPYNYDGSIDDIFIYNKTLTENEIQQLYLQNKSPNSTIAAKDTLLNFGTVTKLDTATLVTYVSNATCDTVVIDNIYTTQSTFWVDNNTATILPYQTMTLTLHFRPSASVPFAGNLKLESTGNDTLSIALQGAGCDLCACPTQDVVLSTQGQVNAFIAEYGGCDTIPVSMKINGGNAITNIDGLDFIKRINGNLIIENTTAITSMNGWESLASIGANFTLQNNTGLTNLDSINKLSKITGSLTITNNNALTSLNGLDSLKIISQNLNVTNNTSLSNCSAICAVVSPLVVGGSVGTGGSIVISNNPSECSTLNEVRIRCATTECPPTDVILISQAEVNAFVESYGTCDSLTGSLTIMGNNITNLTGMNFIHHIGGSLTIKNNTTLPNLNGFQGLQSVNGSLMIQSNNLLTKIDSLHHLNKVLGNLTVTGNNALLTVNGFIGLDTIGQNLTITNNTLLNNCSGICPVISPSSVGIPPSGGQGVGGSISISGNPSECSSLTEVTIFCNENECPDQDYVLRNQIEVNAFVAAFGTCDSIIGNLTIEGGSTITNLSGLSFIEYIGGTLFIKNNYTITSLAGFQNLKKVTGALKLENNSAITNSSQLTKLEYIGGELSIVNNDAVINFLGLDSLNYLGGALNITQNNKLVNMPQLCRMLDEGVVSGSYNISNNPAPMASINQVNAYCIYGPMVTKVLINNLPDSIEEGSLLTFQVAVDFAPIDTVRVSMLSNNPQEVPVPNIVKILPGQTSANVSVLLPNNSSPEKDKIVSITAGAPFLLSASDQLTLTDHDDVPPIELIITQDTINEGAGLYATSAKVKRLGATGQTLNITLQSSNGSQVYLQTGINILANETEKSFYIGVIENSQAEGNRRNVITATVIINSCVCPAPAGTAGISRDSFAITDNDGPSLNLALAPLSMPENKINAGTLTITRNTPTNIPLLVNISVNDTTEISLPLTATIPVGASSVNVPVTTKADVLEDGNQEVTITVSKSGYTSGVIWAIVTDINKPDLIISSAEAIDDTVSLGEVIPFKVYIHNKGLTTSTRGVNLIGYLSADNSIDGGDHIIGNYFLDISIAAGDTIVYGGTGTISNRIGNFNLLFKVNPNEAITELLYFNNISAPVPVTILPNYTGTAMVDDSIFMIGEPIVIYGSSYNSQGIKLPEADLELYISQNGIRRSIPIKTNQQGDYSYTLHPLMSDYGYFIVGAGYPGFNQTTLQDAYNIIGLRINNGNYITWDMLLSDTINGALPLRNDCSIPLSNVTMSPVNLPNGCLLVFNTLTTIPANTAATLPYQIIAGSVTTPGVYQEIPLNIVVSGQNIQSTKAYYHVRAHQGQLLTSIVSIIQNINKDQRKVVEFDITNVGSGNTGQITVAVPNANWVRLVSMPIISNLSPGQKATISVEFIPTSAIPLNAPATGNIAINASNASGVSVPFTITKVSDEMGSITIDVIDQFTYFTSEAPHVDSARVRISNYFTGQIYADGLTNTQGLFTASSLPEGQLRIVVDALRHKSYDNVVEISPGANGIKVVFLEYRAISFSWDVNPTTIEDEYEIDLIMKFEVNAPVPVVVISMPETLPLLNAGETFNFYVNLTNKGIISAKEVALDFPDDPEYELITSYQPQDILANQTLQVPVVMKRRSGTGNGNRVKQGEGVIKEAEQRLYFKN